MFGALSSLFRRSAGSALRAVSLCGLLMFCNTSFGGVWTQLLNQNPEFFNGTMLLLPDGSVIVLSGLDYQNWTKLTPTATNSYVNGTWSYITKMSSARQNFGSTVLTDGRVLVLGGEFTGPFLDPTMANSGEIYNLATNKWSPITRFPEPEFGDSPLCLIPGGYVVAGSPNTDQSYVYYAPGDFWFDFGGFTGGIQKLRNDASAEETWLLQPDGSVLSYDIESSNRTSTATAQRFTNFDWSDSGILPALLTATTMGPFAPTPRLGPGGVLPNGKVIQIGGNQNTAVYTPPASSFGTGTWVAGPSLPAGMGSDDAPGAMLPDGHFVFLAEIVGSGSGATLFDYDFNTNLLTDLTSTLPAGLQSELSFFAAADCRMLIIPNGGLLLNTGFNIWEYKSSIAPQANWKPTIQSITKLSSSRYQLSGLRLNGINEGATFGNEARMSTNFPVIRMDKAGVSKYARTSSFSAGLQRPGSTSSQFMNFDIPAGTAPGVYNIFVSANGLSSGGVPITVVNAKVTASFANGILSIVGDAESNNIKVTYKQVKTSGVLTGATVTIDSTDPFTTVNGTNTVTFNVGTPRFKVNAQMGAGNDTVSFISLYLTGFNCNLGDGDDTATFQYNSITGQLTLDGGNGFDTVTLTGNSIGKTVSSNIP